MRGIVETREFEAAVGQPESNFPQRHLAATHGALQCGFRSQRDNLGAIEVGAMSEQLTQDTLRTLAQVQSRGRHHLNLRRAGNDSGRGRPEGNPS